MGRVFVGLLLLAFGWLNVFYGIQGLEEDWSRVIVALNFSVAGLNIVSAGRVFSNTED